MPCSRRTEPCPTSSVPWGSRAGATPGGVPLLALSRFRQRSLRRRSQVLEHPEMPDAELCEGRVSRQADDQFAGEVALGRTAAGEDVEATEDRAIAQPGLRDEA